uniref:SCP domain-containing protein n=1 Tax=Panagrolaimus sp. ES5 TaxID=591445 RepID=A0AC34FJ42_9BILA
MFTIYKLLICVFLFASAALAQSTTSIEPSCSNPNLLLTPSLRGEILDYINDARNKLKNGQLLLENGEYALIPESMPELSWSCEVEEDMYEIAKEACTTNTFYGINYTWVSGISTPDPTYQNLIYAGLHYHDIAGYYANYLSQHTIYAGASSNNIISALHDKAETVGCAIYECLKDDEVTMYPGAPTSYSINYLFCKITPDVQFGQKVYEVSPNAITNFPSQDVICLETDNIDIELRQMVLAKINAVRQKIQQGTYLLENGQYALKAINLPNLIWSCDEEDLVRTTITTAESFGTTTEPETVFETAIPYNYPFGSSLKEKISDYLDQLFHQNSNLNFLSQSSTYSSQYPAALVLSDQATTIACAATFFYDPATFFTTFNFACRAKPSPQINDQLYQV